MCGGDGSTCETIEGLFNDSLPRGGKKKWMRGMSAQFGRVKWKRRAPIGADFCLDHPSADHVRPKLRVTGSKTKNAFSIMTPLDGESASMPLASGGEWRAGESEKTYLSFYGMASVRGVRRFLLPLCPFWGIGNLFYTVCTPT